MSNKRHTFEGRLGFDIRLPENWEKLQQLLLIGDEAAVEAVLRYSKMMLVDFDKYIRYKISELYNPRRWNDAIARALHHTCKERLLEIFEDCFIRNIRHCKRYENIYHFKNSLKVYTKSHLRGKISNTIIKKLQDCNQQSIDDHRFMSNHFRDEIKEFFVDLAVGRTAQQQLDVLYNNKFYGFQQTLEMNSFLEKLSDLSRSIIIMYHYCDYSYAEIAKHHGISLKNLRDKYKENKWHLRGLIINEEKKKPTPKNYNGPRVIESKRD